MKNDKYAIITGFLFLTIISALIFNRAAFERWPAAEFGEEPVGAAMQTLDPAKITESSSITDAVTNESLTNAKPPSLDRTDLISALSSAEVEEAKASIGREERAPRADQPDEAARFRRMQMQDENGEIPIDGLQKARKQMDRMRLFQQKKAAAAGRPEGLEVAGLTPDDWVWLGPGNVGGRIRSIVIDPNNANNLWVGSVSGGIWRSTDAGVSFQPVNDLMANLTVTTMVINPNSANIMYAGTGEGFGNGDALLGGGVFQSIDSGATWNLLSSTNPAAAAPPGCGVGSAPCSVFWQYVNRLAISPNGTTILAAAGTIRVNSVSTGSLATTGGIARSIDGGATWTQITNIVAQDIDFDPNSNINAIVGELTQCPGTPPCPASARRSTDGGVTWNAAVFSPPITNGGTAATDGRVELAYAPSSSNIIYASVNQNQGDVYQSNDSGQNFNQTDLTGGNLLGGQGWYDNIIWVNPQDPTFVIVGGVSLSLSTDSGFTWTTIADGANGSAHADHHMVVAHPAFNNGTNKIVYFGNDGGLYRADDVSTVSMTAGWTKLNNNLGITQFFGGAISPDGTLFGGTQDNGNIKVEPLPNLEPPYSYNPQSWTSIVGGDGGYVAADPADANYLYSEYTNLTIQRSSNGGASATYIYCNPVPTNPNGGVCTGTGILDAQNGANFVAPFLLDPGNANTMLAGGLSLWRSTDVKTAAMPTRTPIKNPNPTIPPPPPPPATPAPPVPNPISAVAVSATNSNLIVVGHNDGQIFLSTDGTNTTPNWGPINVAPLPARFVTRLAIDNTRSPNWIYSTFGGFNSNNVYVTKDLGITWIDVSGVTPSSTDLPAVPVRSLVINPANNNYLYVGTEVGIFASEDAGATWQVPQYGPSNVSVDELFWFQGDLFAATHGRGVYKTNIPVHGTNTCTGAFDPIRCPTTNFCQTGPNPNNYACCNVGEWNCPCTWNNKQVPGPNDDIVVFCPINNAAGNIKSLTVLGGGTLSITTLSATNDVFNFGLITSAVAGQGSLLGRSFLNVRPNGVGNRGIINVGTLYANDDVDNQGFIFANAVSGDNISNGTGAHIGAPEITVRKDIHNDGSIVANNHLNLNTLGPVDHILSGTGTWEAANFNIRGYLDSGTYLETATLLNDLILNVSGQTRIARFAALEQNNHNLTINGGGSLLNSGEIDLGTGQLNLNLNQFVSIDPGYVGNVFGLRGTGTVNLNAIGSGATFVAGGGAGGFQPSLRILSGTVDTSFIGMDGSLTIDQGAVFNLNTPMDVNGDVTVNGTLSKNTPGNTALNFNGAAFTNNGSFLVDSLFFNNSGAPRIQTISGTGSWAGTSAQIGLCNSPSTSSTRLLNDVTFSQNSFAVCTGSTLNLDTFTLTFTGGSMGSSGNVIGTGTLIMQPSSGTASLGGSGPNQFSSRIRIASGTVTPFADVSGPFTVDAGATVSGGSALFFAGNRFTNNGAVSSFLIFGRRNFQPINQELGGTGTFTNSGSGFLVRSESTTTLFTDVTYTGPATMFLNGRINTGAFTFSMPCNTPLQGAGEVIGNMRRTNLAACPGAAFAFGNPFTTIQFTSGTPPTEITVNTALSSPAGFPNAAQRTYLITPTGGSGYTANLRLHYLDSELNGNNESTLQLFRNDGLNWLQQGATSRNTTDNWVEYVGVTQFSPWSVSSSPPSGPTPTSTPTSTPTDTPTNTPTNTPTPPPLIMGNVTYGNAIPASTRFVSNVLISGAGSPPVSTTTGFPDGNYSLGGFGSGAYTITPSKTGGVNGVSSFDAAKIAQHVAATSSLTGNQLIVADVSNNGVISSFDAGQIARYVASTPPFGITGTWKFVPVSRTYASITENITGENYSALLMGEVSGNWTNTGARPVGSRQLAVGGGPERSIAVDLPNLTTQTDKEVIVPVSVQGAANKGIISYEFDLRYDPNVIRPLAEPVDVTGTASRGLSVVTNALELGLLRVVVYGAVPIDNNGVLLNLRFTAVGAPGAVSPLTWGRIMFNEGNPQVTTANGQVEMDL